jgi:hypothetical protein
MLLGNLHFKTATAQQHEASLMTELDRLRTYSVGAFGLDNKCYFNSRYLLG